MTRAALVILTLTAFAGTAAAQQPASPQPQPAAPRLPPPAPKTGNPTPGTPQPDPPNVAERITVTGCLQRVPEAGAAPASAATVPASNRYILKEAKKATTYRLEALESQLSPFVNVQVELSGEAKSAPDTPPLLLVESVRKIAMKCP